MATITRTIASLRGELTRKNTFTKLIKAKTISFFGGVCLLINGMTGPGVPFTPATFQESGWFFPTVLFLAFALVSALSVLFIIEAMQAVPGNKHFQGTVEFATLINFYFGNTAHYVGQFLLYGALQSNAMQCIIIMAQTLDNILIDIFGKTCGLAVSGPNAGWYCVGQISEKFPSPFEDTFVLFTCGILLVAILSVPLGIVNLDDNILAQVIAFWLSVAIGIQWIGASFFQGIKVSRVPTFGTEFSTVVGTIMLNLAFTTVVPSWVNIKKKDVNTQGVVWSAVAIAVAFYMFVGLLPALGFDIDESGNILPALMRSGKLNKGTAYMFSVVMLLPSIPVNFIVAQSNLVQNKVVGKRMGIVVAHVLPWFLCIPLQTGQTMQAFISWTSLIFVSTANFIIPLLIYIKCLRFRREYNESRALTQKQKLLLKEIHWSSRTIHRFIDDAIARDSGLAEYAKKHPGPLVRERSDLSIRGAIPPLADEDDHQGPPPAPVIIIPPALDPTDVSTSHMPPPSPTGSILKNPFGQLDSDPGRKSPGLEVPVGERLVKLKKASTVRFGGDHEDHDDDRTEHESSARFNRGSSSRQRSFGEPSPPGVHHQPLNDSDLNVVGPVRVSSNPNPSAQDDEDYLNDDVPDPDLEHKLARKETRLNHHHHWDRDPEAGVGGMFQRAMNLASMGRRATSQSVLHPGGGGSYTLADDHQQPATLRDHLRRNHTSKAAIQMEPLRDSSYVESSNDNLIQNAMRDDDDEDDDHLHQQQRDSSTSIPVTAARRNTTSTDTTTDDADLIRKKTSNNNTLTASSPHASTSRKNTASSPTPQHHHHHHHPHIPHQIRNHLPADLFRKQTLPVHPDFISPTFRSIPTWFPVRGRFVAYFLLVITVGVTVGNVIVTFTGS
ncbi:hypothetical protein PhCBS80983_g04782 [Powellomyces hirtus]|uniref:Amino acid transporter transmembrane domain-containing protein n=1 Tax=Powellomyces hirtus TaxID=109895 RepID=A0A507DY38_9FUNG|nr:hypothetical protein PhCBS80983_g04782 [Powellomyces hirtus]